MKIVTLFILTILFFSCKDNVSKSEQREKTEKNIDSSDSNITNQNVSNKTERNSSNYGIQTDTVQFEEFLNGGDYNIFMVKKNRKTIQIYGTDGDSISDFINGENVIVKWKLDTVWEPEYNSFNLYPCLLEIKTLK